MDDKARALLKEINRHVFSWEYPRSSDEVLTLLEAALAAARQEGCAEAVDKAVTVAIRCARLEERERCANLEVEQEIKILTHDYGYEDGFEDGLARYREAIRAATKEPTDAE